MSSAAVQFSRPLQRKLQEAGLQGCVGADAFKRLLQYAEDVGGSLDKVHEILEILKKSEYDGCRAADCGRGRSSCPAPAPRVCSTPLQHTRDSGLCCGFERRCLQHQLANCRIGCTAMCLTAHVQYRTSHAFSKAGPRTCMRTRTHPRARAHTHT